MLELFSWIVAPVLFLLFWMWCEGLWGWKRKATPTHEPKRTPFEAMSSQGRYELWRAELDRWVNEDGTQEGLDRFLERWTGVPHEKPKPIAPANNEVDKLIDCGDSAFLKFVEKNRDQVQQVIGMDVARLGSEATVVKVDGPEGTIFCTTAGGKSELAAQPKPARRFKTGQWVRTTYSGSLCRLLSWDIPSSTWFIACAENEGKGWTAKLGEHYLEPALPREGEWWRVKKGCGRPFNGEAEFTYGGIRVAGEVCTTCNWVPVNFGRGEEAKG